MQGNGKKNNVIKRLVGALGGTDIICGSKGEKMSLCLMSNWWEDNMQHQITSIH